MSDLKWSCRVRLGGRFFAGDANSVRQGGPYVEKSAMKEQIRCTRARTSAAANAWRTCGRDEASQNYIRERVAPPLFQNRRPGFSGNRHAEVFRSA